jgi:proteasome lid subunit RPN8/RPN11
MTGALEPRLTSSNGGMRLAASVARAMLEHATREAPQECCGLLLGTAETITDLHAARNELASATRYRIDPRDHFAAIRRARTAGLRVLGAYHSHPRTAPLPSSTDAAEAWEHFVYVIVSLAPECRQRPLRAWRLEGRNFVEVPLVTHD